MGVLPPLSVLDLAPVLEGSDATASFRNTLDLAQHAEAWGYRRYWLAEHHNMPGVASAATAVAGISTGRQIFCAPLPARNATVRSLYTFMSGPM